MTDPGDHLTPDEAFQAMVALTGELGLYDEVPFPDAYRGYPETPDDLYPCCEHCGHLELDESPGHEYPCRMEGCAR